MKRILFLIPLAIAAQVQQSSGSMDGIQQMLQQIMTYYQQQLQMMQQQQQQQSTMNSQINNQQTTGSMNTNGMMNGMNSQPMGLQQQQGMLPIDQQSQQQQAVLPVQPGQSGQPLQPLQPVQPGQPGQQQQPVGNDNYNRLVQFLQGLNNYYLKLNNNNQMMPNTNNNNLTPSAAGSVVTVTQTIQVPDKQQQKFSTAVVDYLRSHAQELKGDMGSFLRRVIARHDARMERMRSRICTPTAKDNDWGEKQIPTLAMIQTPIPQPVLMNNNQQQQQQVNQLNQPLNQTPLWGVTTTTTEQTWSTSFSF